VLRELVVMCRMCRGGFGWWVVEAVGVEELDCGEKVRVLFDGELNR
jgi:hypothetical protein